MSPAGIPMFYAAANERTAFLETYNPADKRAQHVTFGRFLTARKLRIVDLAAIPPVPSIFDANGFDSRHGLIFLHDLASEISKPIAHDGREHYEYVPTQIVAEYFRSVLKVNGMAIDGIAFRSSRKGAGVSYCVFADRDSCADDFRSKRTRFLFEKKERLLVLRGINRTTVAQCIALFTAPPVVLPKVR
jgi:hypothetical protein